MRILRSDQLLLVQYLVVQASSRSILLTSAAGAPVVVVFVVQDAICYLLFPFRSTSQCLHLERCSLFLYYNNEEQEDHDHEKKGEHQVGTTSMLVVLLFCSFLCGVVMNNNSGGDNNHNNANTITHDYTQDDAIVINDNEFTTQGFAGIPALLKYDTFRGFFKVDGKEKLVSGGRYRPLTPVMFAIEYQLFGYNPVIGHLLNILWFALLVLVLYYDSLYYLYQYSRQYSYQRPLPSIGGVP